MDPVVVVGLVLAAGFWILTQANIIWTKNALSKRVIAASAETKQQAIETVVGMEKRLNEQVAKVESMVAELPDPDDLAIDYEEMAEAFKPAFGPMVSEHVHMAILQAKAQETKAVQEMLEAVGMDKGIEDMGKEAQAAMINNMTIGQQAAYRIANIQPSKKWLKEHPFGSAGWEMFKATQMGMLQQVAEGLMPGIGGAQVTESPSYTGFGVRPR